MATASMKSSSHYENKSYTQQYTGSGFSSNDEDTANYQRNHKNHKPITMEKKTKYTFNGNGIHNKTEEYDPKPLDLSLSDLSNLGNFVQRIRKHRINPLNSSLSPQFVFITNKRNDFDALVRTLIEVYPKSLIQFRFKKSDDQEECYLSEKEANSSVWKVATTKDLVSWNSYKDEFAKIETKDFSETSEYSSSGHDFKWSSNTVKYFNSKFAITTCTNEDKQMEIIHVIKITVQVSAEDREMIIRCLKLNALESDATEICLSQESDGSLSIHKIISDHLKIDSDSIEDTVKGLTFFVGGFEELKNIHH
ncbi:hypothetical protein RirG_011530 [Rhizophagus irregularis DAOM 197198w]|uniref:Uncharacterized protein n=1 Tax=Rhizophagus irregularis (strain DAOM 197198w) TaxID=1432141 RepID=A0A015NHD4_RHIIW|nr:hypothetical protein RirG_011530 [Rhizophagus irregularis DAOM 197198w]